MDFKQFRKMEACKTYEQSIGVVLMEHGYKLGKSVGEGSYSKVYEAYKGSANGRFSRVACKVINCRRASTEYVDKFLPRELEILPKLSHTNLVQIHDILKANDQVFIFMELCSGGDLLDYISSKGPLSECRTRELFHQLVSAVKYLHSYDFSHRDLKCENILLKDEQTVRITDFGFARSCRDSVTNQRILSETFCGSAAYAAPEILQVNNVLYSHLAERFQGIESHLQGLEDDIHYLKNVWPDGLAYNPKMYDVWSLGCILYIMLTSRMPFDDSNVNKMVYIQLHKLLSFPSKSERSISVGMKKLVKHLLEPDVTKRATINQVYNELAHLSTITTHQNSKQPIIAKSGQKVTGNQNRQKDIDELRKKLKKFNIPHKF